MTRKMQKKEIRALIYKARKEMSEETWKKATDKICDSVLKTQMFQEAEEIYCYMDYNHEVGTRQIIENSWRLQKKVFVPKVLGREMEFFEISSFDDLAPGMKGILEPVRTSEDNKGSGNRGLMIMPGVAFDRSLHRIGYGGGFYDRYLETHRGLQKLAVAFTYQVLDEVPAEAFDICPDVLVTESAVYEKRF